ncbi:hypothetical protein GCM10023221_26830 [Luteimicrobium xylanilyticum]
MDETKRLSRQDVDLARLCTSQHLLGGDRSDKQWADTFARAVRALVPDDVRRETLDRTGRCDLERPTSRCAEKPRSARASLSDGDLEFAEKIHDVDAHMISNQPRPVFSAVACWTT